ncbi:MAG TPA: YqgE/AlgH family protein, partial [Burkholderiales bacterium]|nr:YqgE/AlgH family protein [Burkholderiales bacterium]
MKRLRFLLLVLLPALLPLSTGESAEMTSPAIFLVAKPELMDPNFAQSVVLVVFPKETGPVGVILNRPTRLTVKEA